MPKVNIKDATKINWTTAALHDDGYPGDTNIQLGCLMRISDASEAMAKNHVQLQQDLNNWQRWYYDELYKKEQLEISIRAYKANSTRMKRYIAELQNKIQNK